MLPSSNVEDFMARGVLTLAITLGFSGVAEAEQTLCALPDPAQVDPCIVGFWVGDNDAAETINAQLRRLAPAGTNRTVVPAMPAALALIVSPGGAYVTMPFAQNHAWIDESEEDLTLARMAIAGSVEAGYMTASGGNMTYCTSGDAVAWLDLGMSSALGGAKEITIPIEPSAGAQFRPAMQYSCAPNYLQIDVILPAPINRVQYRLGNVGAEAFGEYYSAAVLDRLRMGPAAAPPTPGVDGITPVTPVEVPIPGAAPAVD